MSIRKTTCNTCAANDCPIKKYAIHQEQELLEAEKITYTFSSGQQIFHEGAFISGIHILRSGKVSISVRGKKGRLQTIRLLKSTDIIGHRGMSDQVTYPISSQALVDTTICFFPLKIFNSILINNGTLTYAFMRHYIDEITRVEKRLVKMSQFSSEARIADAIIMIVEDLGISLQGELELPYNIIRQEISAISATSKEQVISVLSSFHKRRLIEKQPKRIIVTNSEELKAMPSF